MVVVVPGEGILELLAQRWIESLPGKAGRDVFGLTAPRRDDACRQYRGERRHGFEGAVGMPELVRLVAQGKPVIRRHDLAVLVDRAEDHEIGANAQRADFGYFERSKATRVSKLRLIGDVLVAKDNDRMLLKGRTRHPVRGVVRRDLGERYPAQLSSKARTQRHDVHRRPPFGVCSTLPPNRLVWRFAFATAATDPAELTPHRRRCPRFSDRDRDPRRRRALARAAHAAVPAGRSFPRGSAAR